MVTKKEKSFSRLRGSEAMISMPLPVAHMNNLICEAFYSDGSEDVADSGRCELCLN